MPLTTTNVPPSPYEILQARNLNFETSSFANISMDSSARPAGLNSSKAIIGSIDSSGNITGLLGPGGTVLSFALSTYQTAVPIGIPSNGTMGNNGALSALTATLPFTYAGGIYLYFPASAIVAGSAAGFYYCVMSSTTAGTVFNNTYTPGTAAPTIPASPTAFATTGPGAFTQVTTQIILASYTVLANSMGSNGRLWVTPSFSINNSANNKSMIITFGASAVWSKTRTTSTNDMPLIDIRNRGATNRQFSGWNGNSGPGSGSTATFGQFAIDTTVDQTVTATGQLANATDFCILEALEIQRAPF